MDLHVKLSSTLGPIVQPSSSSIAVPASPAANSASGAAASSQLGSAARSTTQDTFTEANLLASLLTLEGLAFAVVTVAVTLANPAGRIRRFAVGPALLAKLAAGLVSVLAIAAGMVWVEIFARDFPDRLPAAIGAIAILVAIVAQTALAWLVALASRLSR